MQKNSTDVFAEANALLKSIDASIMKKALIVSLAAHLALMVLTSFGLFIDWAKYGVKSPSAINRIRMQENREAEEARRKAAAAEKAAAEQKAEKEKQEAQAKKQVEDAKKGESKGGEGAKAADGEVKAPEVEALPPKKEFELGDDLSLD